MVLGNISLRGQRLPTALDDLGCSVENLVFCARDATNRCSSRRIANRDRPPYATSGASDKCYFSAERLVRVLTQTVEMRSIQLECSIAPYVTLWLNTKADISTGIPPQPEICLLFVTPEALN
jgi:hypothetical protein